MKIGDRYWHLLDHIPDEGRWLWLLMDDDIFWGYTFSVDGMIFLAYYWYDENNETEVPMVSVKTLGSFRTAGMFAWSLFWKKDMRAAGYTPEEFEKFKMHWHSFSEEKPAEGRMLSLIIDREVCQGYTVTPEDGHPTLLVYDRLEHLDDNGNCLPGLKGIKDLSETDLWIDCGRDVEPFPGTENLPRHPEKMNTLCQSLLDVQYPVLVIDEEQPQDFEWHKFSEQLPEDDSTIRFILNGKIHYGWFGIKRDGNPYLYEVESFIYDNESGVPDMINYDLEADEITEWTDWEGPWPELANL